MFARFASRSFRTTVTTGSRRAIGSASVAAPAAATIGAAKAAAALAVIAASASACATSCHHDGAMPHYGVPATVHERTFIAIKPDGVQRALVGEVISRFEKKGYKLVAMKMIWPSKELAAKHYDDLKARSFFKGLVDYFSSGPIVAMVWEGPGVILTSRQMLGATNPNTALPGTLRGDHCITVGRNLIHGSDGPDSAKHEISMWFEPSECADWPRDTDKWITADN